MGQGAETLWHKFESTSDCRLILDSCSLITALLLRKSEAFAAGQVEVYNPASDKKVRGEYKEWEQLLKNPNPVQSQRQFLKQLYINMQLRGWCYVLKVYPAGFTDRPARLWILPPWCIEIDKRNKPIYQLENDDLKEGVWFNWNGTRTKLDKRNLMLFTDSSMDIDMCTWLPYSRMRALKYPLTNFISAMEARTTLIQKKGAIGILSSRNSQSDDFGVTPMSEDEKVRLDNEFQGYGLSREQRQVIISTAALTWQPMVFDAAALKLFEEVDANTNQICDVYNYPVELLSSIRGVTFANKNEAKKLLYQDAIIPEAADLFEQYNRQIGYDNNKIETSMNYSALPILQEDELRKAQARKYRDEALQLEWKNDIITKNIWLKHNNEEPLPADQGDVYYSQTAQIEENGNTTEESLQV
jgi:hypothetical protein